MNWMMFGCRSERWLTISRYTFSSICTKTRPDRPDQHKAGTNSNEYLRTPAEPNPNPNPLAETSRGAKTRPGGRARWAWRLRALGSPGCASAAPPRSCPTRCRAPARTCPWCRPGRLRPAAVRSHAGGTRPPGGGRGREEKEGRR
jgi:hypothetical protein